MYMTTTVLSAIDIYVYDHHSFAAIDIYVYDQHSFGC